MCMALESDVQISLISRFAQTFICFSNRSQLQNNFIYLLKVSFGFAKKVFCVESSFNLTPMFRKIFDFACASVVG